MSKQFRVILENEDDEYIKHYDYDDKEEAERGLRAYASQNVKTRLIPLHENNAPASSRRCKLI